jgi:hypothetical protein
VSDFTDRLDRIEALLQGGTLDYDALPLAKLKTYMEENLLLGAQNIEGNLPANRIVTVPVVTALPAVTDIDDGQEIAFVADATNGIVWKFKYRNASASARKWEFIGGQPLLAEQDTGALLTTAAYTAYNGSTPQLTTPLQGDYLCQHGATLSEAVGTADIATVGISVDGAAPAALSETMAAQQGTSGNTWGAGISKTFRFNGVGTGKVILQKYACVNVNVFTAARRWLTILPVRV